MEERAVHTIQKHWRLSRARTAGEALSHRLPLELLVTLAYLLQLPEALRADTSVAPPWRDNMSQGDLIRRIL